jgi:WD40 repeat protein
MIEALQLTFFGPEFVLPIAQVWDPRKPEKVKEIAENEDYISGFTVNSDRSTLLATSGDQTLTVIDYGSGKALDRSVEQDDELLCLALIKGGRKVVCGGQSGLISVFTWDQWTDRSSVCPGHLESIDCMLPVDDNTVITGCGDGIIRIVSILPNKILGVISAQSEELPITAMSLSHDKKYLAACVDTSVQFWNVSMIFDDDGENEEGAEEEEDQVVEEEGGEDDVVGDEEEEEGEIDLEAELTPSSESDDDSDSDSSEAPVQSKFFGKKGKQSKAASFYDGL